MVIKAIKPLPPELQVPVFWPVAFGFSMHFILISINDLWTFGFWHFLIGQVLGWGMMITLFTLWKPKIVLRHIEETREEFEGELNNR